MRVTMLLHDLGFLVGLLDVHEGKQARKLARAVVVVCRGLHPRIVSVPRRKWAALYERGALSTWAHLGIQYMHASTWAHLGSLGTESVHRSQRWRTDLREELSS